MAGLLLLEVCEAASLGVDVGDLVGGLRVEVDELLAVWGGGCLVVVGGESVENTGEAGGDAVGLVGSLGLLGRLVLGVEIVESLEESVGDAVLLVEI